MQFNERNPVRIGLVVVVVATALSVAALAIQRSDLVGGFELTAEFTDAAGLREGDIVSVAGIRAGVVTDLAIEGTAVVATMQIEGTELPSTSRAVITPQTIVGKRNVAIETGRDFSDLLDDGDVIPLSRTDVLVDVPQFADASEELLTDTDAQVLNTFVGALTELTSGQRDELALLVEGGTRATSVINDQEDQIRELLRQLRQLSGTLNDRDQEILRIVDDLGSALNDLAESRDDVVQLFRDTNASSATAADLVAGTREELSLALDELHRDLEIVDRYQVNIAEAIAYAPDSIGGFASIAFAGEQDVPWGWTMIQGVGPANIDPLFGCSGLIDRQLDLILGPDPRSCTEQGDNETLPEDVGGSDEEAGVGTQPGEPGGGEGGDGPGAAPPAAPDSSESGSQPSGSAEGAPRPDDGGRMGIDELTRSLLPGGGAR